MTMQPSMWSCYLIEWQPRAAIECLAEHGWHAAELGEEHAHDLLKEGDPLKVGAEFRRWADDCGVAVPQGHLPMSTKGFRPEDLDGRGHFDIAAADHAEFEARMDDMRRWIDLFNAVGIEAGVLHVGGVRLIEAGWSADRVLARRVEALSRIAEYARGGPTKLCLENYSARHANATVAATEEIIAAVGADNLAICLDTGHANLADVDIAAFIRAAGPRLKALHIADNLGRRDDHILPYGAGTIEWTDVMKALRDIGYAGIFNFEVPGEEVGCPPPVRLAKLDYALALAQWMIECDGT